VATVMVGMTSTLSRARRQAEKYVSGIEPDLSHLSDEQLQAMRNLLESREADGPMLANGHCVLITEAESTQFASDDVPCQSG